MTPEEEKKLVAEKLMGWFVQGNSLNDGPTIYFYQESVQRGTPERPLGKWNPESERKWWPEIWEKMDEDLFGEYYTNLSGIIIFNNRRGMHTAKPEICWKALIKTLESK